MKPECPVCGAEQSQSLLCSACCDRLERDLGDVASIVGELETTMSKQAKIGAGSGTAGLARERMPISLGAMEAADNLGNVLTTWARDVSGNKWSRAMGAIRIYRDPQSRYQGPLCLGYCWHESCNAMETFDNVPVAPASVQAAAQLLTTIDAIRRHPAVNELVDEISDAIAQARRAVDRPIDKVFVGPCLSEQPDDEGRMVTCLEDLYARQGASTVRCKVCTWEHDVAERRAWLLEQARDRLFTVREAAQMMGDVGGITVTESRIRGYIHRPSNALNYRPGTKLIRLGDLLTVVIGDSERKGAA